MSTATLERPAAPFWQDIVLSFVPPARRDDRARALLARLPFALILVGQAALTWRLSDIVFDDEALYIDAGHDVIRHAIHGDLITAYGNYLSGAPAAYPVIAGTLDSVGGLMLVRFFSLLFMLLSTVFVRGAARRLFGVRAGLLSALVFALAGSILFVGKLATYDALCVMLLAAALWVAVTRRSIVSGVGVGALLSAAAVVKYAGAGLAPFVLLLMLLTGSSYPRRDIGRAVVAGVTSLGLLLGGYLMWGHLIVAGLRFTTTGRTVEAPTPYTALVGSFLRDAGLLLALAVIGAVVLLNRRSWRLLTVTAVCLAAGALIPFSQIRIHEFVSLDKHSDFSALFFSLPAGFALDWALNRRVRAKLLTVALLWLVLVDGMWRSNIQYAWPKTIMAPIAAVNRNPIPGTYLSFDGDTGAFYTKAHPEVKWQMAYNIYAQGPAAVLAAVRNHTYAGFLYQTGNESDVNLATQRQLTAALDRGSYYRLVGTWVVNPYLPSRWYLWQRVVPPGRAAGSTVDKATTRSAVTQSH